jgi:hypothetical protein
MSDGKKCIKIGNVKPKRVPWNDEHKTPFSPLERWGFVFYRTGENPVSGRIRTKGIYYRLQRSRGL